MILKIYYNVLSQEYLHTQLYVNASISQITDLTHSYLNYLNSNTYENTLILSV